jgi:outer membrane protein assembly factor BamB
MYGFGGDGYLYAVSPSGQVLWMYAWNQDPTNSATPCPLTCALNDEGTLLVATSAAGTSVIDISGSAPIYSEGMTGISPTFGLLGNTLVVASFVDDVSPNMVVVCFDGSQPADSPYTQRWSRELSVAGPRSNANVMNSETASYVMLDSVAQLFALDIKTGSTLWSTYLLNNTEVFTSEIACTLGVVVVSITFQFNTGGGYGRALFGVSAASGALLWKREEQSQVAGKQFAFALASEEFMYTTDGLSISAASGNTTMLPIPILPPGYPPSLLLDLGGALFFTWNTFLYAYDTISGERLFGLLWGDPGWDDSASLSNMAMNADGALFIGLTGKGIFAVSSGSTCK